jgi:alkylhydroperoxidase family enzyme
MCQARGKSDEGVVVARIDLPDGEGLDVVKALTIAPQFAATIGAYEKSVAETTLDPRLHELVRYRIAQVNECELCLGLRRGDVPEELLQQVAEPGEGFTEAERVALRFADQFAQHSAGITDELVAAVEQHLGTRGAIELALVCGKYLAFGRFMQVLGLDQACALDHAALAASS